jgi:hypothetical protein
MTAEELAKILAMTPWELYQHDLGILREVDASTQRARDAALARLAAERRKCSHAKQTVHDSVVGSYSTCDHCGAVDELSKV